MEQYISWKRSYAYSILIHIGVILILGALLMTVVQHKEEQQVFEVDLTIDQQLLDATKPEQGESGGGQGRMGSLFPKPLTEEVLQKKVAAVTQSTPEPIPEADRLDMNARVVDGVTTNANGDPHASEIGENNGPLGNPLANTLDGEPGPGDGNTPNGGSGGPGEGTGGGVFDSAGFADAVDSNKSYPAIAVKRRLEGTVYVSTTIDGGGNVIGVSGSGEHSSLVQAAEQAVWNVGYYPNPTGETVTVTVPVTFYLN